MENAFEVIPNWADGALIVPIKPNQNAFRASWVPDGWFVVGYAGNLGRAHDVDTIVEAMTLLQERAKARADDIARQILFVFVGGRSSARELRTRGTSAQASQMCDYIPISLATV